MYKTTDGMDVVQEYLQWEMQDRILLAQLYQNNWKGFYREHTLEVTKKKTVLQT